MKAEQMFKELGYKVDKGTSILYVYELEDYNINIYFDTIHKEIELYIDDDKYGLNESIILGLDEMKAITKQMKELGWLD